MYPLRPFQAQALRVLDESSQIHLLCISATGSGKSRIYETLAARPQSRTLLISPLVALARQQQASLQALGIAASTLPPKTLQTPQAWLLRPESLLQPKTLQTLRHWRPTLLVIDECHCLWEWGEHFRPAFQKILPLVQMNLIPKTLWLTATLPQKAEKKLIDALTATPFEFQKIGAFSLPEHLVLRVRKVPRIDRWPALRALVRFNQQRFGAGILFAQTRQTSERLKRFLEECGISTLVYHAGFSLEERRALEASIQRQEHPVIVATSAFGMGMDYSHLHWSILWEAPLSLLALTQAIGRAGRGATHSAVATVFWSEEDFAWTSWARSTLCPEQTALRDFLTSRKCLRHELSTYFSNEKSENTAITPCGRCSNCENFLKFS